jgi:hypothetical protein
MPHRSLATVALLLAAAAAPTLAQTKSAAESPADRERAIIAAVERKDFTAFNEALGADFVYVDAMNGSVMWERAKSADMLKSCQTGNLVMTNLKEVSVTPDVRVLTYTITGEQTCNGVKAPPVTYALSVWKKMNGRWIAVAHSETPKVTPPANRK